jgi:minor extracellular protease Epr
LLQSPFLPPPQNLPPPPPEEDKTMEPGEVVVVSGNMNEAQALATQAQALGLEIKRRSVLKGLGFVVTVLRVPKKTAAGSALAGLRGAMPNVWADVNHRYKLQGAETNQYGRQMVGWTGAAHCGGGMRIGLLDSAVDKNHPALRGRAITEQSFLPAGIQPAPPDHGTATAALLVANPLASGLSGLVPDAHLYIANIFRDRGNKEIDTTAEWMALALDWLVNQQVLVINMSLGGPRNLLVEAAILRLQERGIAVVAAAGNGGEQGPPVYPAAQLGVVAVTAVDAKLNIYKHATHGDYIAFSAPGVDIWSAAPGRDGVYLSGTSYATPFVTAAMASAQLASPKAIWPALERQLQGTAR